MVAISSRLSLLAIALYLASAVVAADKPYAPELMARTDMGQDKREIAASRPYAPELYDRAEEGHFQIKRNAAWDILSGRSDEDLEARSSKKSKKCYKNSECSSKEYCSGKYHKCYSKKDIGSKCFKNNTECFSKYCSVKTDKCRAQAPKNGACVVDDGCKSGLSCVNGKCHSASKSSSSSHKPAKTPTPSGSVHDKRVLRSA